MKINIPLPIRIDVHASGVITAPPLKESELDEIRREAAESGHERFAWCVERLNQELERLKGTP